MREAQSTIELRDYFRAFIRAFEDDGDYFANRPLVPSRVRPPIPGEFGRDIDEATIEAVRVEKLAPYKFRRLIIPRQPELW